jgi:hypothetical protein
MKILKTEDICWIISIKWIISSIFKAQFNGATEKNWN